MKILSLSALLAAAVTLMGTSPSSQHHHYPLRFASASEGWAECGNVILNMTDLPYEYPGTVRICRAGVLAISYDGGLKNPAYSQYYITPQQAQNLLPGRDSFYNDPDLLAMGVPQAGPSSKAFGNDWNRGHLAPNHIMSFSKAGKKSCFTMANICPQGGYFNQQPWERTETKISAFVANHTQALHIITGVAYTNRSSARRTVDNIAVPNFYWTVLCDAVNHQSAGFFGINEIKTATLTSFVPVTEIEKMYGGKLFPANVCNTASVTRGFWWRESASDDYDAVEEQRVDDALAKLGRRHPDGMPVGGDDQH